MSPKRKAWNALKRNCPEFEQTVREIAGRFGISGVACAGAVWGDVDAEDVEWCDG